MRGNMIGFEISLNDTLVATVGANDIISLNAVLAACGDLSGKDPLVTYMTAIAMANGKTEETFRHDRWEIVSSNNPLSVGDKIGIRIVETDAPTAPDVSEEIEREEDAEHQPEA
jgi:hypothetical protein